MSRELTSPQGLEPDRQLIETSGHTVTPYYGDRQPIVVAPGDPVGLNELTTPLWRGRKTIAAAAGFGLLLGAAASLLMPTIYRARTSVQLEGINNDRLIRITASIPNASAESYVQNQVKVLESDTLAERVADSLGTPTKTTDDSAKARILGQVKEHLSFLRARQPSEEEKRIKAVKDALTVRTSLQSQVIELFFDAEDPHQAARGANAASAAFVSLNRDAREQLVRDTTEWLNKQAVELKASIEKSNRNLQDFARSSGLILAGPEGTLAQQRTLQTQEALARAQADRAAKQSRYETAKAKGSDLFADALATGPFRQYQVELGNMRQELAQLNTLYTPTNYKVERLQARIAETERAMEEERRAVLARIGNEYTAAAQLEKMLADSHSRQLRTAVKEMADDRQYSTLKSEIDTTQKLYETVLQKAKEAGAESALASTNIRVIDPAKVPSTPHSPRVPLNMAIGFALGSLGGIGLVLVSERSGRVRRPGDLERLDIPELGVIPSAIDVRALEYPSKSLTLFRQSRSDVGLVARDFGNSILSESFRGVMTSILLGDSRRGPKSRGMRAAGRVLVITSVDMMEGKTTILTNLGVVAAQRKQRVLLIDADLRRPRLHDIFDLPNNRGLTDELLRSETADHLPIELLIQQTTTPGLSVLTSGPVDDESETMLHSADLRGLLQHCRADFDLILVDTPPLMLYADARVLGRMSDGIVMVVRANRSSQEELRAAYERLRQDQTPVLGTILNDWKMDPGQTRAYGRYGNHYQKHA